MIAHTQICIYVYVYAHIICIDVYCFNFSEKNRKNRFKPCDVHSYALHMHMDCVQSLTYKYILDINRQYVYITRKLGQFVYVFHFFVFYVFFFICIRCTSQIPL